MFSNINYNIYISMRNELFLYQNHIMYVLVRVCMRIYLHMY